MGDPTCAVSPRLVRKGSVAAHAALPKKADAMQFHEGQLFPSGLWPTIMTAVARGYNS